MEHTLNQRIQKFYDRSSHVWLDVWGEHMHHGFYGKDGTEKKNHKQAQLDLIEEVLDWADIKAVKHFLDAGCGVGGSARYLADKYGASGIGVTLSKVQKQEGDKLTMQAGLDEKVQLRVRDMCTLTDMDQQFDLVWSMESAEHIPDKQLLMDVFYNTLQSGGKFLVITWCRRNDESALTAEESGMLEKLYRSYQLPPFVRLKDLEDAAANAGFKNIRSDNWSRSVLPFWKAVVRTVISWKGVLGLIRSGMGTMKGALAMRYMIRGLQSGLIEFVVLTGQKPK